MPGGAYLELTLAGQTQPKMLQSLPIVVRDRIAFCLAAPMPGPRGSGPTKTGAAARPCSDRVDAVVNIEGAPDGCGFAVLRTHAEAAALQLMSLEAHANPGPRLSGERGGLWAVLDAWSKEAAGAGTLPQLLRSYADAAPRGIDALDSLFRAACAAAMDLLSDVMSGVTSMHICASCSPEQNMLAPPGCNEAELLVCAMRVYTVAPPDLHLEVSRSWWGIKCCSATCLSFSSLLFFSLIDRQ